VVEFDEKSNSNQMMRTVWQVGAGGKLRRIDKTFTGAVYEPDPLHAADIIVTERLNKWNKSTSF